MAGHFFSGKIVYFFLARRPALALSISFPIQTQVTSRTHILVHMHRAKYTERTRPRKKNAKTLRLYYNIHIAFFTFVGGHIRNGANTHSPTQQDETHFYYNIRHRAYIFRFFSFISHNLAPSRFVSCHVRRLRRSKKREKNM